MWVHVEVLIFVLAIAGITAMPSTPGDNNLTPLNIECIMSTDCRDTQICINLKCGDPCIGACGKDAKCEVSNHNPICRCPAGMIGDPFVSCIRKERDPCRGLCGYNAYCTVSNHLATCTCPPNMNGNPIVECKTIENAESTTLP